MKKLMARRAATGLAFALLSGMASASLTWDWNKDYDGSETDVLDTLLLWRFEDTGGPGFPYYRYDSSGNGHDWYIDPTGNTSEGVPGKFGLGGSIDLPAASDRRGFRGGSSSIDAWNGLALAVEVWFKPATDLMAGIPNPILFSNMGHTIESENRRGIQLYLSSAGGWHMQPRVEMQGAGTAKINTGAKSGWVNEWKADTWYHFAVTYIYDAGTDIGTLSVYLDGQLHASVTDGGNNPDFGDLSWMPTHEWHVGNRNTATHNPGYGSFDNFRVAVIPEPGTLGLLAGAGALALIRRRLRRKD